MHKIVIFNFSVPFPPITDIIRRATNSLLIIKWNPVVPDCSAIHYNILASSCGSCPTTTNHTNITCTDTVLTNNSMCTFTIQTVVCGNISGNSSAIMYTQERALVDADDNSNSTMSCTCRKDVSSTCSSTLRGNFIAKLACVLLLY